MADDTAAALRRQLGEALHLLGAGDSEEAQRQAKTVSALVKARREVAELEAAAAIELEDDVEARRAELRRRFLAFVEADVADAVPEVLERIATTGSAE
jgi:hypothetical protein